MLTVRQENFCREYLVDGNAAKAVVRAGYSERGASTLGPKLLARPAIVNEISCLRQLYYETYDSSTPRIKAELGKIAFAVLGDYATWGPDGVAVIASDKLTQDQMAALSEVSEVRTKDATTTTVKPYNKLQALQLLGKANGMFIDKHKIEAMEGAPIVVLPVMYRGDKEGGPISEDPKNEKGAYSESTEEAKTDD